MIVITATVEVHAEHWEDAKALAQRHCEASRREPGCVSHDWYPHPTREHTVFFYEQWRDRGAIDAHFAEPYSAELVRCFQTWARADVVLRMRTGGEVDERVIVRAG